MRKTTLLWASVCLVLSGAFRPLDAAPERKNEEDADGTGPWKRKHWPWGPCREGPCGSCCSAGPVPPAAGLVHQFCAYRADPGPCKALLPRFFFNALSGQCEAFMYGGCRGNQNRFESQEACRERCIAGDEAVKSWTHGRPYFCFQYADMGPCRFYFKRYFYNHRSGHCEVFVYGGCWGNLNNFKTEADCQHSCGDPDDSAQPTASSTPGPAKRNAEVWGRPYFCFLDAHIGPCHFYLEKYFYNHRSGRCEVFMYGGCWGNRNNFETEPDCQRSCGDPGDSAQLTASSTPGTAKRNATVWRRPYFCFLDADMGPCRLYFKKYFYNHRSGRCEAFAYGGCWGNRNNFETEADCQRSCGDPDDSPQPTVSSTPGPAKRNAAVWGRLGLCYLDADMGPCHANIKNYFYNHRSGRCEEFVFGGCMGNLNNFETEAACQYFCRDPSDSAQPSASSTLGPAKRNAAVWGRHGICFLDAEVGPCHANIKKYFYNHRSGRCEVFEYGGCWGNRNNFETEAECQDACGDPDDSPQPTVSSTAGPAKRNATVWGRPGFCFLYADMGPCDGNIKKYFYNHRSGRCEVFVYGGCRGNLNNFKTEAECQRFCGDQGDRAHPTASSTPGPAKRNAAVWVRPGFCFLDADMGPCHANIKKYFYNHRSGRCEVFVFGGCWGNLNNFKTEEACQRSCGDPDDSAQPTASSTPGPAKRNAAVGGRHYFCFLDADMGPCRLYLKKYFYNHRYGRCEVFVYGGCWGNLNNFETEADCQRSCADPDDSAQPTASATLGPAKRNAAVGGRPDFCFLDADMGPCRFYLMNYFYNHRFGRCDVFLFGGCRGNLNKFETEADCQRSCGDPGDSAQPTASSTPGPAKRNAAVWDFTLPSWCLTGADRGQCTANVTRFYYDSDAGTCRPFSYSGCRGNENNFVSERACLQACKQAFTKRTPKGRLMETKRRKDSVEIGYEIY